MTIDCRVVVPAVVPTPVAGIRVVTFEEVCKAGQVKEVEPIVPDADALAIIMCARQDTNDSTISP